MLVGRAIKINNVDHLMIAREREEISDAFCLRPFMPKKKQPKLLFSLLQCDVLSKQAFYPFDPSVTVIGMELDDISLLLSGSSSWWRSPSAGSTAD